MAYSGTTHALTRCLFSHNIKSRVFDKIFAARAIINLNRIDRTIRQVGLNNVLEKLLARFVLSMKYSTEWPACSYSATAV